MTGPLISVIIPAYNCEKYIAKAIESVLEQEDVLLELLIINDCSTDHTEEIILTYGKDDRIRYLKNDYNIGVAKTRNKGVQQARGEFVAFLDADDWWDQGKLKKQIELMRKKGQVLCSTARELVDEHGRSLGKVIPVKELITYRLLLLHNCINCSSVVLKKDVAKEFPMEHEDSHEDYITWLKILQEYGTACAVNEPLLKYRLRSSSKSGSKLHSARMTYKVYRYSGFGYCQSIIYFLSYALHGLWKYR